MATSLTFKVPSGEFSDAPANIGSEINDSPTPFLSSISSCIVTFSRIISPVFSTVMVYSIKSLSPFGTVGSTSDLFTTKLAVAVIVEVAVLLSSVILSPSGAMAVADAVLDTPPVLIDCWLTVKVAVKSTVSPTDKMPSNVPVPS